MTNAASNQHIADILSGNFIIVDLRISCWGATKKDKQASEEVAANKQAKKGAASVTKPLMHGADADLVTTRQAGRALRALLDANSSAWEDGRRIIPATEFMTLVPQLESMAQATRNAADIFLKSYPAAYQEAMLNLGQLGKSEDYPDPMEMPSRFGVTLKYLPVPSMADYSRVSLPPQAAQELATRMADDLTEKAARAQQDALGELSKELDRMATQLGKLVSGEPTRMYDTLVTNMRDCAVALEHTNFFQDSALQNIVEQIKTRLVPPVRTKDDFRDSIPLARAALNDVATLKAAIQAVSAVASTPGATQPQTAVSLVPMAPITPTPTTTDAAEDTAAGILLADDPEGILDEIDEFMADVARVEAVIDDKLPGMREAHGITGTELLAHIQQEARALAESNVPLIEREPEDLVGLPEPVPASVQKATSELLMTRTIASKPLTLEEMIAQMDAEMAAEAQGFVKVAASIPSPEEVIDTLKQSAEESPLADLGGW